MAGMAAAGGFMSQGEIAIATPALMPLQASKWIDLQLLVDELEMAEMVAALGDFEIFMVGRLCSRNEGQLTQRQFIEAYGSYVQALKAGELPNEQTFRPLFSSIFTVHRDALAQMVTGDGRRILRVTKPVVQLQLNKISYSHADGKFRSMVFGSESFFWGLQLSYPQLYLDSETKEVYKTRDSERFPNGELFRNIQQWQREHTIPTPFHVDGRCVNVPMRLGRKSLSWINSHPQLAAHRISVSQP
jgi:hypothetical protein